MKAAARPARRAGRPPGPGGGAAGGARADRPGTPRGRGGSAARGGRRGAPRRPPRGPDPQPPPHPLTGRGFSNPIRGKQLARHQIFTTGTRSHRHHRVHRRSSHATPHSTRCLDRASQRRLPQPQSAPGHRPGLVQLRHDPRPAVRPPLCRHRLAPLRGRRIPHPPLAAPGVLPARRGPIGDPTSGARCHHLLRPFAGLGAQRLAVEAVGLGPGCHQPGRRLHRVVDQRRVPRLRPPRGLEDPPRPCDPRLEARVARLARGILSAGVPGLDRRREDRSPAVRTLALPCARRPGLASSDADHPVRQVPQAGGQGRRPGQPVRPQAGSPVAGPREGVPEEAREAAGMHAPGLLGRGLRRTVVCGDGPGAGAGRGPVGWDAGLDRARIQAAQERRLALGPDADDRLRPCRAARAGAGGGDAVRAGRGRGLRGQSGGPRGDDPRAGPRRRDGGSGRDQALGRAPGGAVGAAQSGVASPSRGRLGSAPRGRRSGWSACSAKGSRRWSLL